MHRIASSVTTLIVVLALVAGSAGTAFALAAPPVALAGSPTPQEHEPTPEEHTATGEHEGEHGAEHAHKNHVAFFIGSTEAEEHHGEKDDRDFTIGIDYERRLSKVIGVGALVDWVAEGNREIVVGVPLFLHAGRHAKFQIAPAYHDLSEGEDGYLLRTGFMWDFHVGKITLSPAIFYDFTEEEDFTVFGLNIGTGF